LRKDERYRHPPSRELVLVWILEGELAISPAPPGTGDLEEWKREGVRAVVVLLESHELDYLGGLDAYLELLRERGFETLHSPVRDFYVPTVEQCLEIVKWIEERVEEGKPVLIHCYGGLGRSGTVAACYLVYRYRMEPGEAIGAVRERRRGAVESPVQAGFVFRFAEEIRSRPSA